LALKYIELAPGFARECLAVYEAWDGKKDAPYKLKELMLVFRIEVNRLYKLNPPREKPKPKLYMDARLDLPREGPRSNFFSDKAS
jgi:hypothetical protein